MKMREKDIGAVKYLRNLNGADWGVFIEKADILATGQDYNERWLSFKVNDFREIQNDSADRSAT
jgi:hypothetical protein